MKAMLVSIDLLVRVIVEDNATEEQIVDTVVEKCQQNKEWSFFGESVTTIMDDIECPFEKCSW